jgi:hypothetical protein
MLHNNVILPLYRATRALQDGLPSSPGKAKEVVAKIAEMYGGPSTENASPQVLVCSATEQQVKEFLYNDEISRAAPGLRDRLIIRDPVTNAKEYRQTRHLLSTLKETHLKFKEDNSGVKLGFSSLAKIRAKHCPEVLLSADMPSSCCRCSIHENFLR